MGKKNKSSKKIEKNSKVIKVKEEYPIHIKLENGEAITGKKDLLSSEINLLKIFQSIENYKRLRSDEIKKKRLILKKSREVRKNLSKIQGIFPQLKIPKILKEEISEIKDKKEKLNFHTSKRKNNVEQQLLEIQERLNKLSQ